MREIQQSIRDAIVRKMSEICKIFEEFDVTYGAQKPRILLVKRDYWLNDSR